MKTLKFVFLFICICAVFIFAYIPFIASNLTLLTDYKQSTGKIYGISANLNSKGKITGYKYQFMFLLDTLSPVKGFVNWSYPDHYREGDSIPIRYARTDPRIYEYDSARWIIWQTLLYTALMALAFAGVWLQLRETFGAGKISGKKQRRK